MPPNDNDNGQNKDSSEITTSTMPHHTPCRPGGGRTFLTIGQDVISIQNYLRDQYESILYRHMNKMQMTNTTTLTGTATMPHQDDEEHHEPLRSIESLYPYGVMAYTDLHSIQGLDEPVDFGSGIEYATGLLSDVGHYQIPALQMGVWLNGTNGCEQVLAGALDDNLSKLVQYWSRIGSGHIDNNSGGDGDSEASTQRRRLFVRIGYEFDNPDFGYIDKPGAYRNAYRHIVQACRNEPACSENVDFVWHSWAASKFDTDPTKPKLFDFYPGDDVVDWVGVSIFSQFYPIERKKWLGLRTQTEPALFNDTLVPILEFANTRNKPIMIADSAPYGGIDEDLHDPWNDWFQPILTLIEDYDIGMWSYINCDWDQQPMWQDAGFGDSRLARNATVMQLWYENVMQNPRFIQARDVDDLCPDSSGNQGPDSSGNQGPGSQADSFGHGTDGTDDNTDITADMSLSMFQQNFNAFQQPSSVNPSQQTSDLPASWTVLDALTSVGVVSMTVLLSLFLVIRYGLRAATRRGVQELVYAPLVGYHDQSEDHTDKYQHTCAAGDVGSMIDDHPGNENPASSAKRLHYGAVET